MSEELGKIEKPAASNFKRTRKIFLVPLVYSYSEAHAEYVEKFDLFWRQVAEQISNLESKLGKVKLVLHESISTAGDEGLKIMEKMNPKSHEITVQKCQCGARLEIMEDKELAEECMDWERCLFIGFLSDKVARKISESYFEASKRRYELIGKNIDKLLKADEAAVLFIREGHRVQFPQDIEVFSVAPPALDEIHRWLRDRESARKLDEDDQPKA